MVAVDPTAKSVQLFWGVRGNPLDFPKKLKSLKIQPDSSHPLSLPDMDIEPIGFMNLSPLGFPPHGPTVLFLAEDAFKMIGPRQKCPPPV